MPERIKARTTVARNLSAQPAEADESLNPVRGEVARRVRLWPTPEMSARGDRLAKDRDGGTTLSVLRAEDVPLQEVSGVCLRREAGGDIAVVAFGDRTSLAAWVELPRDDADEFVWKPEDLALTRHGRAMIALDTKKAKENLVLLDPPIAAVGPA